MDFQTCWTSSLEFELCLWNLVLRILFLWNFRFWISEFGISDALGIRRRVIRIPECPLDERVRAATPFRIFRFWKLEFGISRSSGFSTRRSGRRLSKLIESCGKIERAESLRPRLWNLGISESRNLGISLPPICSPLESQNLGMPPVGLGGSMPELVE